MTALAIRDMIDPVLRDSRHPGAAAARDQADWLSFEELGGMAPSSLFTYQWTIDKLLALFPDKQLEDFTEGDLAYFLKQFPKKSWNDRAKPIKSFFKWARQTRRITDNPVDFLPTIKQNKQPEIQVFTVAEQANLEGLPEPHGTLMAMLFGLGLRKAEASNLTRKRVHFDWQPMMVSVIEGAKNGVDRIVPLRPALASRLDEMFTLEGISPDEYMWPIRPGGSKRAYHDRPVQPTSFHKWWTNCLLDAKVKYRNPHVARHTYATRWRQRGLTIEEIQRNLGHASIQTTSDMYVHLKTEEIASHMDEIERQEARGF